jgi:hexosaminidase
MVGLLAVVCSGSHPALAGSAGTDATSTVSLVPRPRFERIERGFYVWGARVRIASSGFSERGVAEQLRAYLREHEVAATVSGRGAGAGVVLHVSAGYDARLGDEGYALRVQSTGVTMRANTPRGLFYALQTLEQLSARSGDGLRSRAATVVDRPAYRWRGIHLDVARHFFAVPVIERYIDVAAHYKLNTFHWHLTDDQAWRLRSDRYPQLAGANAYSKADVSRIVRYAAMRFVTVVPEIDLPGHAGAAVRAYPRLSCGQDTLCMSGAALDFARGVWDEAMRAFPSPYLHAGGDEVPPPGGTGQQQFTDEIERRLHARGRRLVGWDEILTPRLSPRAVVMAWTGPRRAVEAARHGNDVVIASGQLYFDAAQGDAAQEPRATAHMSTLEQVYDDRIMPVGLTRAQAAHVLGGEAAVWTEHIATPEQLFSMTLPRELALAEILWTPSERKDWGSFLARLPAQLQWLDVHRYPFRIPNASFAVGGNATVFEAVAGHVQTVNAWTSASSVTVALTSPLASGIIRYTTNGAVPTALSQPYRGPFAVRTSATPVHVRAAVFFRRRAGAVTECAIARSSPAALRARTRTSRSWSSLVSP